MLAPITIYTGGGIRPVFDTDGALTDAVQLPAGKFFAQGRVLGQILGTGSDVNEVQTITPSGTISGGTFILVYDGELTTALAFNASIAVIQAALEALPSIGAGGVVVGGGPINTTPTTYTFQNGTVGNPLGGKHHPLLAVINSLTGTTPILTPSLTTLGKPAGGYWDNYDDAAAGAQAGLAVARRVNQYDFRTDSQGRAFPGQDKNASDNFTWLRAVPAFFAGTFRTGNGTSLELLGLDANGVADLGKLIAGDTSTLTASTTILRMG